MSRPFLIMKCGSTFPKIIRERGDHEARYQRVLQSPNIVCEVWKDEPLPPVREVSHVFVTGSASSVTEPERWMTAAINYVRRAADAGIPVIGLCFGHQLLGHAFGGRVIVNPRNWELGTVEVALTDAGTRDPMFTGFERSFLAFASHRDIVVDLPAEATVLASNDHTQVQAFAVGDCVRGVQFHIEIDEVIARGFITERADIIRRAGLAPETLAKTIQPRPALNQALRNFFHEFGR